MWGGRASPGAVLTVPPRSLLPRPRRLVGFSSCARDCGEFRARDFPALCRCWTTEPPCCQRYRARPPSPSDCCLGGSVTSRKCPPRQAGNVPPASGGYPHNERGMSPPASGECPPQQVGNVPSARRRCRRHPQERRGNGMLSGHQHLSQRNRQGLQPSRRR